MNGYLIKPHSLDISVQENLLRIVVVSRQFKDSKIVPVDAEYARLAVPDRPFRKPDHQLSECGVAPPPYDGHPVIDFAVPIAIDDI